MNFEDLIFATASECVEPLIFYFAVIMVLDFLRMMLFDK